MITGDALGLQPKALCLRAHPLMKITATIITLNEEAHLGRCLQSLREVADEMVVADSGSIDQTREIARSFGARVVERPWSGFSDQKNFAAEQSLHPWILNLDADECLSDRLKMELLELKKGAPLASAFSFARRTSYLGHWINHSGWYPDVKVRLYLKHKAAWSGPYVHEALQVQGEVQLLGGDLLHYTCDSLSEHHQRVDRYTDLAAAELWAKGKRAGWSQLLGSPFAAFVKTYFFKAGFLDGRQGFYIAIFSAYYNFLKYAKLREKGNPAQTGK
jgi:glycosyltransferase involved in cell wall biosynthesis